MTESKTPSIPSIEFEPQAKTEYGFELLSLESLYEKSADLEVNPFAAHRVHFHHVIYIADGSGDHFIDFNNYTVRAGSFVFVNKNQVHAFDADNRPKGLMVLFTQEYLEEVRATIDLSAFLTGYSSNLSAPVVTVDRDLRETCETLLSEIGKLDDQRHSDRIVIRLLFASLLLKLLQNRRAAGVTRISDLDQKRLTRFLSLVEENFSTTKDATDYAKMLGTTYKSLNQLCKVTVRKTPKQIIDAHTILEAKRRLAIDNVQISQLAYELGFEDVSNFTKYFKKHTLVSPTQFKRQIPS